MNITVSSIKRGGIVLAAAFAMNILSAQVVNFSDLGLGKDQIMSMRGNGIYSFESDDIVFNYYRRENMRSMNGEFDGAAYCSFTSYSGVNGAYSEMEAVTGGGMNLDGSINVGGTYVTMALSMIPYMPGVPRVDLTKTKEPVLALYVTNTTAVVNNIKSTFTNGDTLKLVVKAYDSDKTELTDAATRVEFLLADFSGDSLEIAMDWQRVDLSIFQVNYGDRVSYLDFEMSGKGGAVGFTQYFSIGGFEFGTIPEPSDFGIASGALVLLAAFAGRRARRN